MGTLRCSCGFRALIKEKNRFNPCKSDLFLNARDGFSVLHKSTLTGKAEWKFQSLIRINHQNPHSRNSTIHSCARDLVVAESPDPKEVLIPSSGSTSQSLPSINIQSEHLWSSFEIAEAVDGEIIRWGPPGTISTDTRKLMPGQWFFAIAGENFDGHDFLGLALADKGCAGVIGNRVLEKWGRGFIRVEGDTLTALEKMAVYARNRFRGAMVGLTGTVGKTTTRTMIALALEGLGRAYQTHGNQNYMVGVALTLIGIPLDVDVSVVELGMGGIKGEILEMARMCRPSVRVILNVGHCHMDHFKSLEEVARAKGELLMEAKPGDICVLNADDPLVMSIPVPVGVKKVLFGRRIGTDVRLVMAESVDGGCAVRVILENQMYTYGNWFSVPGERTSNMVEFKIHGPGLHLAMNACAAAAVAISLGVPLTQIGKSLSRFRPVRMRSEMEVTDNGIRIINDTYNASLTSMLAAIKLLKSMDCRGKRVAILGDMLELGATEEGAHELVLNLCCDPCIGLVMLAGKSFAAAAKRLGILQKFNIICAPDSISLEPMVTEFLAARDVVLVKGSRGMQMEKVVDAIKTCHIHDYQ